MKWNNIIKAILIIFIVLSAGYMGFKEFGNWSGLTGQESITANPQLEATGKSADKANYNVGEDHKVIAYYFHGDVRCETCRQIEAYSHEALTTGFPKEIQEGDLQWQVVNIDEPDNKHFWQDFNLVTWSLILVATTNGRQEKWKNLDKVWQLVDDRQEFLDYVQAETQSYLGAY